MIKSVKIRIFPSREQEILMFKSVGVSRFAYNWGLARWEELYKQGMDTSKYILKKEFNNILKKKEEYKWLYEVSASVATQALIDLGAAFTKFFKKESKYPKFRSRKRTKKSFYVRYDRMNIKNNTINIEKIGRIRFKTKLEIPILDKYINPRCSYDGKYWYLAFGFEQDENQVKLNQELSI